MNSDQSNKLEVLFEAAIDLSPDSRAAFLDEHCADDTELRRELELLLVHDEAQPEDFLQSPVGDALENMHGLHEGAVIDEKYTLLRVLGEGGMGVVYLARQNRPRRTVALKLIRPGVTSRALLRRFEQETQILGRLQHPGIAQIHDAGTARNARTPQPYFAMEYVRGLPLLKHAQERSLRTSERLELFVRICDAVHYAHEQGVIHRDLKPGNILVDEHGQPKILDFGVARATNSDVQMTTLHTNVGQLLGTLPYMSPEQVSGAPNEIDERSDVYALGVLCYELLTGELPYDLRDRSVPDAARIICDQDPQTLASMNRTLRGDADTIVAKSLEKDKDRRYASAAAFAEDVRRHLRNEPITARRPTTVYQLRKFARRNKALVSAVAIVFVVLVAAVVVSLNYAIQANLARNDANEQADEAQRQAYLANIAAADGSLQLDDVPTARRRLEAIDPSQRDTWEWPYLYSQLDDSRSSFAADVDYVSDAAFMPDGRLLTTSSDGRVIIWDAESGAIVREFKLHDKRVSAVACSPDGSIIASAGFDIFIRLTNAKTGEVLHSLPAYSRAIQTLAFSPDGRRLVSGGFDNTVRVWDVAAGEELHAMTGHTEAVNAARFTPDGSRIVSASSDADVRVWNAETGECLRVLEGRGGKVWSVDVSPDGGRIVTGSVDGALRLFDIDSGRIDRMIFGNTGETLAVAFSPDGRRIASGSTDTTVRIWDGESGEQVVALRGHRGDVACVTWSDDGRFIASTPHGVTGAVHIWDAAVLDRLNDIPIAKWVRSLAFSPDGSMIVGGRAGGLTSIWDSATAEHIADLSGHERYVFDAEFSPDGTLIATGGADETVRLWDAATGRALLTLVGPKSNSGTSRHSVHDIQFSPDGSLLAAGSFDGAVRLWDVASQRLITTFEGHTKSVTAIAFSPDGSRIASSANDATARLWNIDTGECIAVMDRHAKYVLDIDFSPDGEHLVTASSDRTIRFWDPVTGKPLERRLDLPEQATQLAFTPDSRRLITALGGGTIRLWDPVTLEDVLSMRRYATNIQALVVSPDMKRIVVAAGPTLLYQWQAMSATELIAARRERAAIAKEVRPLVEQLFDQHGEAESVIDALRTDASLSAAQRRIALQLALGIACPPNETP